jgi:hypothetical protein
MLDALGAAATLGRGHEMPQDAKHQIRRLYLDVGDLLDIGDGRIEPDTVSALRSAMRDANTRLVISTDHVQDVWRAGDAEAVESLVRAVEAFQPVLAVMDGPDAIEPLTAERNDIVVAPCTTFRQLVYSEAAPKSLKTRVAAYDRFHEANLPVQQGLVSEPPPAMASRRANELYIQALITLVTGWRGDDVDQIVGFWQAKGHAVSDDERLAVVARLRVVREAVLTLRALAEDHGVDMTDALRCWGASEAEPAARPGTYLALRVSAARFRNVTRKPRASDWLDLDHAKHFPYVDVATCDGNTLSALRPVLATLSCPRRPVVLQNKRLSEVVDAVRTAPRLSSLSSR